MVNKVSLDYKLSVRMHVDTKKVERNRSLGCVKWTEMRKQNIQAKKFYSCMDRLCDKKKSKI